MRSLSLLIASAALLAAALPADGQTSPRRAPADTLHFGATRPAAGDSIRMAEYEEDAGYVGEDTVPAGPPPGPYSRSGGTGPFSVQASGEVARRTPRSGRDVVWLQAHSARPAAADTARGDTGSRVASAAASRPAPRDSAGGRPGGGASTSQAASSGRQGASGTGRPSNSAGSASTAGRTGRTTSTAAAAGASGRTGTNGGSAPARARSHTVVSGETFFGIARRYGVTAAQLRAVNPDVEMDDLKVGDVLRLPAAARDSRAASNPGRARTQPRASGGSQAQRRTHTVVSGETLFGIARRYGVTVNAIREANEMETDQVRTGQRLVIPPAR